MDHTSDFDLGPLTWVKGEIDNALDIARRQVESWNGSDGTPLRTAATHLHQVQGALQIVDLRGVSRVCEAAEQLLAAMETRPETRVPEAGTAVLDAITGMQGYLDGLLAGTARSELALAPVYRELMLRMGEAEPAPSELFYPDIDIRASRLSPEPALDETHRQGLLRKARRKYQRGLVQWLTRRDPEAGMREMRTAVHEIEQAAPGSAQYTFWWAAAGLLETLQHSDGAPDFWTKRLLGRLDLQLKRLMEGSRQLTERLMRDVLYYQAGTAGGMGRGAEVDSLFELRRHLPETSSRVADDHDAQAIKALREALEQVKEHWLRYASGKADAIQPLQQAMALSSTAAGRLDNAPMHALADAVARVGQAVPGLPGAMHDEALHLELAATLLFAQNALDHYDSLGAEFAAQAELQARRLDAVAHPGGSLDELPSLPLLDEFSRQAQEKLLLAQVTQEIEANLHQVETILDAFFRNREERKALPLVPGLMNQILGALNMLQLDVAADLARLSMDQIGVLSEPEREITQEELDWIADAVSSLGLYVEALRHGRDDQASLRSLLAGPGARPEEGFSVEAEVLEKTADVQDKLDQWVEGASIDAEAIKQDLASIVEDAELIGDNRLRQQADDALRALEATASPEAVQSVFQAAPTAPAEPSPEAARLAGASAEEIDAELLAVYIAEAHEVLGNAAGHLDELRADAADRDALTNIRRGFHTLKGSGRMVGLHALGEVAWEVEQTLNLWLREARIASVDLLACLGHAIEAFSGWVSKLEAEGHADVVADALVAEARALRGADAQDASDEAPTPGVTRAPTTLAAVPEARAGGTDMAESAADEAPEADAQTHIGEHVLPTPLFEIFVAEARQRLDSLDEHWASLRQAPSPAAWEAFGRSAHTLAGISRTTGFEPLAEAAHGLELWAVEWAHAGAGTETADGAPEALIAELRRMYAGILEGAYPDGTVASAIVLPPPTAPEAVPVAEAEPEPEAEAPVEPTVVAQVERLVAPAPVGPDAPMPESVATVDELDPELLPIFLAETEELLPRIGETLRAWRAAPGDGTPRQALQRALHTLKGSARMAGALSVGDATHRVESSILEQGETVPDSTFLEALEHDYDHLADLIEHLKPRTSVATPSAMPATQASAATGQTDAADDGRFRVSFKGRSLALDTLINETGEVSIARSRLDNVLSSYKQTAEELTMNVERLRGQLRELELQADAQMRAHQISVDDSRFDPLEFDRYTRLQELTRLMAESVNDVATAQESLVANLSEAETALTHQAKMTRSLQQQLMHIRMVPINSQAERLHRIVRQAAKETGHKARLHIEGGATELDRTVLERVFAPLEHLLRNAVAHGVEGHEARKHAGKPEYGEIRLAAKAEGNEVALTLSDDGAGIDYARVRQRAEALGWVKPGEVVENERLEGMLFLPGLSTAREVTQVAGRGIGLDVVKNEIAAMGGRVRLESTPGAGTRFVIRLPLTLAIAQVVLARAGAQTYALPAILVALVREPRPDEWTRMVAQGNAEFEGQRYPLRSLAQLTGQESTPHDGRHRTTLLLRTGDERVALRVDALQGNAEAVVKNIGPQLARIPGIAGATVLGDGRVALILNPFALMERTPQAIIQPEVEVIEEEQAPLILVVDDSLTVRKITGRLLTRQGYRVATAKDGAEALEMLQDEPPDLMLLDIEMPRMDGFELTRHIRADARTRTLPIIMITSRTAEKHRLHAFELGVDTFMGKPYQDEALLQEIGLLLQRAPARPGAPA
jgi:chemosensory pili system protein ChpA (sensor histidine kinase/response regulator)